MADQVAQSVTVSEETAYHAAYAVTEKSMRMAMLAMQSDPPDQRALDNAAFGFAIAKELGEPVVESPRSSDEWKAAIRAVNERMREGLST